MTKEESDRQVVIDVTLDTIRKYMEQGYWTLEIQTKNTLKKSDNYIGYKDDQMDGDCEMILGGVTITLNVYT